MTMTFCFRRDQSTGPETCLAGMVSDQLLGTRQSKNGVKGEKNGAKYEQVGFGSRKGLNQYNKCIYKYLQILQ